MLEDDTNIIHIGRSKKDITHNSQPQKLIWYWDEADKFELDLNDLTYEKNKYSFFDTKHQDYARIFNFYIEIRDGLLNISKGESANTAFLGEEVITFLERYSYTPTYPVYIGSYNGYKDVFAMSIYYHEGENYNYPVIDKKVEQIFYFNEDNGKWVLIDNSIVYN